MFATSADFNSQTLSYGCKGALFSSFLKLLNDISGSPNNLQTSFSQVTSLQLKPKLTVTLSVQRVISYSSGLVDFAIGQVNSVLNLLDGLVKFFGGEFK